MKTIIAGTRTITDQFLVDRAVADSGFKISKVFSGKASGVDALGEQWAKANGVPVESFPAEWNRYGKMAGPLRNQSMVNRADALIAIWDGKSRGTMDVINRAKVKGIPVFMAGIL